MDDVDPEELAQWRLTKRRCRLCWNLASCCMCSRIVIGDVIDVAETTPRLAIEASSREA